MSEGTVDIEKWRMEGDDKGKEEGRWRGKEGIREEEREV